MVSHLMSHYKMDPKNFLINKMSEIQSVGHFLRTSTGYRVTRQGYVLIDK